MKSGGSSAAFAPDGGPRNYRAVIRAIVLSGGRRTARAEQGNFVERSSKNGPRIVPAGNLRSGSNSDERRSERRSMQRLADVAGGIRGTVMLVQKTAAAGEIQQGHAQQRRANPP